MKYHIPPCISSIFRKDESREVTPKSFEHMLNILYDPTISTGMKYSPEAIKNNIYSAIHDLDLFQRVIESFDISQLYFDNSIDRRGIIDLHRQTSSELVTRIESAKIELDSFMKKSEYGKYIDDIKKSLSTAGEDKNTQAYKPMIEIAWKFSKQYEKAINDIFRTMLGRTLNIPLADFTPFKSKFESKIEKIWKNYGKLSKRGAEYIKNEIVNIYSTERLITEGVIQLYSVTEINYRNKKIIDSVYGGIAPVWIALNKIIDGKTLDLNIIKPIEKIDNFHRNMKEVKKTMSYAQLKNILNIHMKLLSQYQNYLTAMTFNYHLALKTK